MPKKKDKPKFSQEVFIQDLDTILELGYKHYAEISKFERLANFNFIYEFEKGISHIKELYYISESLGEPVEDLESGRDWYRINFEDSPVYWSILPEEGYRYVQIGSDIFLGNSIRANKLAELGVFYSPDRANARVSFPDYKKNKEQIKKIFKEYKKECEVTRQKEVVERKKRELSEAERLLKNLLI
jgi:hypothetical protein